jgi:uncharacterized protein YuzE
LSEDVYLDLDSGGHVISITVEHASKRSDLSEVSFLRMNDLTSKTLETVR